MYVITAVPLVFRIVFDRLVVRNPLSALPQVTSQDSAQGVSSRSLEMWLLTLFTRMSSTLIKRGYLPEDKSGDYMYQVPSLSFQIPAEPGGMRLWYFLRERLNRGNDSIIMVC